MQETNLTPKLLVPKRSTTGFNYRTRQETSALLLRSSDRLMGRWMGNRLKRSHLIVCTVTVTERVNSFSTHLEDRIYHDLQES